MGIENEVKASVFPNNKVIIEADYIKAESLLKLEKIEGIIKVTDTKDAINLTINDNFKLGGCLSLLEAEEIVIKKISYEEPKLEDVFLNLTGKTLRD